MASSSSPEQVLARILSNAPQGADKDVLLSMLGQKTDKKQKRPARNATSADAVVASLTSSANSRGSISATNMSPEVDIEQDSLARIVGATLRKDMEDAGGVEIPAKAGADGSKVWDSRDLYEQQAGGVQVKRTNQPWVPNFTDRADPSHAFGAPRQDTNGTITRDIYINPTPDQQAQLSYWNSGYQAKTPEVQEWYKAAGEALDKTGDTPIDLIRQGIEAITIAEAGLPNIIASKTRPLIEKKKQLIQQMGQAAQMMSIGLSVNKKARAEEVMSLQSSIAALDMQIGVIEEQVKSSPEYIAVQADTSGMKEYLTRLQQRYTAQEELTVRRKEADVAMEITKSQLPSQIQVDRERALAKAEVDESIKQANFPAELSRKMTERGALLDQMDRVDDDNSRRDYQQKLDLLDATIAKEAAALPEALRARSVAAIAQQEKLSTLRTKENRERQVLAYILDTQQAEIRDKRKMGYMDEQGQKKFDRARQLVQDKKAADFDNAARLMALEETQDTAQQERTNKEYDRRLAERDRLRSEGRVEEADLQWRNYVWKDLLRVQGVPQEIEAELQLYEGKLRAAQLAAINPLEQTKREQELQMDRQALLDRIDVLMPAQEAQKVRLMLEQTEQTNNATLYREQVKGALSLNESELARKLRIRYGEKEAAEIGKANRGWGTPRAKELYQAVAGNTYGEDKVQAMLGAQKEDMYAMMQSAEYFGREGVSMALTDVVALDPPKVKFAADYLARAQSTPIGVKTAEAYASMIQNVQYDPEVMAVIDPGVDSELAKTPSYALYRQLKQAELAATTVAERENIAEQLGVWKRERLARLPATSTAIHRGSLTIAQNTYINELDTMKSNLRVMVIPDNATEEEAKAYSDVFDTLAEAPWNSYTDMMIHARNAAMYDNPARTPAEQRDIGQFMEMPSGRMTKPITPDKAIEIAERAVQGIMSAVDLRTENTFTKARYEWKAAIADAKQKVAIRTLSEQLGYAIFGVPSPIKREAR